jgi:non-specific protein-tyrosine kinase
MSTTRTISANGLEFFIREAGSGPLVLLCHGWPELSYSWRHQLAPLAEAGYHVVAPDMRGFGRTSAPQEIGAYTIFDNVGDVVALVRALGATSAAIIGHDWGAPVAWHAALFRPDVFPAVAGLSVPPPQRGRTRPLQALAAGGMSNFYLQYFQTPGVAEAEFERDVALTMQTLLARGFGGEASLFVDPVHGLLGDRAKQYQLPPWISADDLAEFVSAFEASGFRGGLNWYRNLDRNWDLTAPWQDATIDQPSLFIAGSNDAVISSVMGGKRVTEMERVVTDLRGKVIIDGAGHWIQQERPSEVNAALLTFLSDAWPAQ